MISNEILSFLILILYIIFIVLVYYFSFCNRLCCKTNINSIIENNNLETNSNEELKLINKEEIYE